MPGSPVRCAKCGFVLADAVLPEGQVVVGELSVAFRRNTDFMVCERCLAAYRVSDLLEAPSTGP